MEHGQFSVVSVGVNSHGASVIRIMLPSRAIIEVATNVIGLSKLAGAGCAVNNDYRARTGKAG